MYEWAELLYDIETQSIFYFVRNFFVFMMNFGGIFS